MEQTLDQAATTQPMPTATLQKVWGILSVLPMIIASLGGLASYFAYENMQGKDIAVAYALSFTLAELIMLVAGLGIVAYIKGRRKTPVAKGLGVLNVIILFGSGVMGFKTFLLMVG